MKPISDILKTSAVRIKKILWILGSRAFFLILFFVFLDFILGGFIFYKYVFLAVREESKVAENVLKFDVKTYQEVLGELQARDQSNKESSTASQPNPSK